MSSDVVYTVLIGGYDPIHPQPVAEGSGVDFICFTDNPSIEAQGWQLVEVEPMLDGDPVRSQRMLKILGHEQLAEYDRSLYIDNTIELRKHPSELLDHLLEGRELGLFVHSFRERLIHEFDEVVRLNYDDAPRVHEQLWTYSQFAAEVLEQQPLWTAILARKQGAAVDRFNETWAREVLRYSRRDQLSVLYALSRTGLEFSSPEADNFESEWHKWSTSPERRVAQGKSSAMPPGPLLTEALRSKGEAESAVARMSELEDERAALEARIGSLSAELADVRGQLDTCEGRTALIRKDMGSARVEREELRNVVRDMTDSTSWKVTKPLRAAGAIVKKISGRR